MARLDTLITMVDAYAFFSNLESVQCVQERRNVAGSGKEVKEDPEDDEEDTRSVAMLLAEQVEFANLVVVNKCDLVDEHELARVVASVKALNPQAHVIQTTRSKVPLESVLGTGLYDYDKASRAAGWLGTLEGITYGPTSYGMTSFVYRARKPFHPQRLHELLDADVPLPWRHPQQRFLLVGLA